MPRWRLKASHYINIIPQDGSKIEWEYKEIDRTTGKQGRKVFAVPMHLFVKEDSPDNNYPGEIIVAQQPGAQRADYIFTGEPTPDMEPLDEEAIKISTALAPKWQHPIESLSGDFGASLISKFERQMTEMMKNPALAAPTPSGAVSQDDFAKLQTQVAELMARNAELESKQPQAARRRSA